MLQKGQKIKLSDIVSSSAFKIDISASMKEGTADIACFGVDKNGKLSDDRYFIFYNQTESPERALAADIGTEKTTFTIDLDKLPDSIERLVFTLTAEEKNMSSLNVGSMNIYAGERIAESFDFGGSDFEKQKAIILCEIYKKDSLWRMSMVVNGFNGGLSALLANFGGEETKDDSGHAHEQAPKEVKEEQTKAVSLKKVSLTKSGDSHRIDISKNRGTIHVNLNWNKTIEKGIGNVDLDLACMYRLKDGSKGVVQALGNSFGSETLPPYIRLDMDDRTGQSLFGENMFFYRPETVDFAVIFAYIYEGIPNWDKTDATITLKQQGSPDIELNIGGSVSENRFFVFAKMVSGPNGMDIVREEKFFRGHIDVDMHYGFGFRWVTGRK
ncbi:MAG: hypothetical protein HFE62_03875 [Firmicutes bacterium]|nr:hypothetical protein [Bacillota bacterium]